jgi:hypothetical protein
LARAVFDPRGVVGAECLLAPRISHLEGCVSTLRSGTPVAQDRSRAARLGAWVALLSFAMTP